MGRLVTGVPAEPGEGAHASAALVACVLEALRDRDTPADLQPEEELHRHMTHRLGLSDVVHDQIRRYRRLGLRGRVPAAEAQDLLRLVARRPDAAEIFDAAGRRLARLAFERRNALYRWGLRLRSRASRVRAALRHVRVLAPALWGTPRVRTAAAPPGIEVYGALGAGVPGGRACALYGALLEDTFGRFTGTSWQARHDACEGRRDGRCAWTLYPAEAPHRSDAGGSS